MEGDGVMNNREIIEHEAKNVIMKRYLVIIGNESLLTRLREKISKGRVIYDKSRM